MQEVYEFRVAEQVAPRLFHASEGTRLGGGIIRKVQLRADDPRIQAVAELQRELTKANSSFFFGWRIFRRYTKKELAHAELFLLSVNRMFEPEGEACGTLYDDTQACALCGAGAPRIGPLVLDTTSIPKRADIASSIASERVISRRLAQILRREGISGVAPARLLSCGPPLRESADWVEPGLSTQNADISPATQVGEDPFVLGPGLCPRGDLLGLNLISEVSIKTGSRGVDDIVLTRQFVGARRGVLRPRRLILVSPKVRAVLLKDKARGCEFEVAYLVP